jgi:hypothetical protein
MSPFDASNPPTPTPADVAGTTVRLRRNAGQGWIDLILEAASPAEADRLLGEEAQALRQRWQEDMTLQEALEVQRLSDELDRLRTDLRRAQQMRHSSGPPLPPDQDHPEPPQAEGEQTSPFRRPITPRQTPDLLIRRRSDDRALRRKRAG